METPGTKFLRNFDSDRPPNFLKFRPDMFFVKLLNSEENCGSNIRENFTVASPETTQNSGQFDQITPREL